jgi:hypothetical protein
MIINITVAKARSTFEIFLINSIYIDEGDGMMGFRMLQYINKV